MESTSLAALTQAPMIEKVSETIRDVRKYAGSAMQDDSSRPVMVTWWLLDIMIYVVLDYDRVVWQACGCSSLGLDKSKPRSS